MNAFINKTTYPYSEYRAKVSLDLKLSLKNITPENEEIINYTKLNETRMNRLDKTLAITDEVLAKLNANTKKYTFYVISEGWCGDAAQLLPVVNKLCEASNLLDLKIIFRDENLDIMDLYLTNGARSIPKLIICDENGNEVAIWGPRPAAATKLVSDLKLAYGGITDELKEALQKWYNTDKGLTTQNEIVNLL